MFFITIHIFVKTSRLLIGCLNEINIHLYKCINRKEMYYILFHRGSRQ